MQRKSHIAPRITTITIVGTGGTGSYLAQGLAKLIAGYRLAIDVTLIDPDVVEEKNCSRQNFQHHEIGQPKASTLAYRLNQQYGLSFASIVGRGETSVSRPPMYGHRICSSADFADGNRDSDWNRLVITCVDSVASRKHYRTCGPWLDLGNGETTGQAIYGTTAEPKRIAAELDRWNTVPGAGQLPNAWLTFDLDNHKEPKKKPALAGCADQPFAEQGCFVNEWAAQAGLAILHQLLVVGSVNTPAIYFDTRGRMSPQYITREYLGGKQ